ncbi:hypothetical protein PINS_up006586 [Pythium insidiosum]|nr:hypothetical protein PINS_up006586 [Pythium insidiosum]
MRASAVVAHTVHVRPRPRSSRRLAVRTRCARRIAIVALVVLLAWIPLCVLSLVTISPTGDLAAIDWQNVTLAQWRSAFTAARDAWTLPQVYRAGPRVRVKLLVAQRISMTELISGEGILTQQLSELTGVSAARVQIEYIETMVTRAEDRGAYSLSLGVSALMDPEDAQSSATPSEQQSIRMAPLIDSERMRIIDCLRFGCIVRDQNITIPSLNLFGSSMQLLDIALDGEAFYPIDLTPWVEARLVVAPDASSAGNLSTAVVPGTTVSSSSITPAVENLLLRFVLAQTLAVAQLSSSSIIVRDAWKPPIDAYNREAVVIPIEIHVGDNDALRAAVDALMRNTSLPSRIRQTVPLWTVIAVDVNRSPRTLTLPPSITTPSPTLDSSPPPTTHIAVALIVQQLSILRVQQRQWRIIDSTRAFLMARLPPNKRSLDGITIARVEFVPLDGAAGAVSTTGSSKPFENADVSSDPLRAQTLKIVLVVTALPRDGAATVNVTDVDSVFQSARDLVDLRIALGFVDYDDTETLHMSAVSYSTATPWSATSVESDGLDSVEVSLTIAENDARSSSTDTLERLDAFGVHQIQAAIILLVQQVFVNREDSALVSVVDGLQFGSRSTTSRCRFRLSIRDDAQRAGVVRVLQSTNSWRLRSTLRTYTSQRFQVDRLEIGGSTSAESRLVTLPGTSVRVGPPILRVNQSHFVDAAMARVRFNDPSLVDNNNNNNNMTSVEAPASCPPAMIGVNELCFRFELTTSLPQRSLIIRQLAFPGDVEAFVNNQALRLDLPALAAPWARPVPDSINANITTGALIRFRSSSLARITVQVVMEFADVSATTTFYPAFAVNMELSLRPSLADAVVRSQPSRLLRPSLLDTPAAIASWSEYASVKGFLPTDGSAIPQLRLHVGNASYLGFFDQSFATRSWGPACSVCTSLMRACHDSAECNAIAGCFQSRLALDGLAFDRLLRDGGSSDLSSMLTQCLSPPKETTQWSSEARSAFVNSLMCAIRESCPLAMSPSSSRQLVLQYTPRTQTLTFTNAQFQSAVALLLESRNGRISTRQLPNFSWVMDLSGALQDVVLDLFGTLRRGMVVRPTFRPANDTQPAVVQIEYHFLDAAVASLPFISIMSGDTAVVQTPVPTDSLLLTAT